MKKRLFWTLCLLAGGVCFGTLKAEEIVLQDLYGTDPMDNSKEDWVITTRPGITAQMTGGVVKVDFNKPAGSTQVVISRGDGSIFRQHDALNPQHITVNMSGAPAGRYMLEVYTDEDALGGMFEVR